MKPPNIANAPKAAQTAAQNAAAAAKKVAQDELLKMRSEAAEQVGLPTGDENPEGAHPQQQEPDLDAMKAQSDAQSAAMLRNIEAEIAQIRAQRIQKEQERVQQQQVEAAQTQQVQEEKKLSLRQKVEETIKKRIAGKREQGKQAGG